MTILVLELRAPATLGPEGLGGALVGLWSRFATFFISFIVLGVYWFANHQVFHFVLRVNRTLVWLNVLFLMGIALIPFAASLMGTYPQDPIALSLYGAVLGLLAALGYVIWWYLTGDRGLIEPGLDPELVHKRSHGDVLHRDSVGFEQRDVVVVRPRPDFARDDFADLVDAVPCDQPPFHRLDEVAALFFRLLDRVGPDECASTDRGVIELPRL